MKKREIQLKLNERFSCSKDVRLPISMQRAMAAEAEAIREAKAKIVAAEGELNASKALKQASDVMSANPITLQVTFEALLWKANEL